MGATDRRLQRHQCIKGLVTSDVMAAAAESLCQGDRRSIRLQSARNFPAGSQSSSRRSVRVPEAIDSSTQEDQKPSPPRDESKEASPAIERGQIHVFAQIPREMNPRRHALHIHVTKEHGADQRA